MSEKKMRGALLSPCVQGKKVSYMSSPLAGGFCNPALEGFMECQISLSIVPMSR